VYYNGLFYDALVFDSSSVIILAGELELQRWTIDKEGNTTLSASTIIGGVDIDTSKFATTAQLQELDNILSERLGEKQEKLVSGENIKTFNGESVLGGGDIVAGSIVGVETGDNLEDVEMEYTTKIYVDNTIAQAITTTLNTEV
jgi:hypothetical protein